jgi:xylulose-5-phosphate/fructose-6-phosphate phosphoketolase
VAGEEQAGAALASADLVDQPADYSLVWRQDHNGFTHQDPGFLDVVTNKSPEVTRIYLPPDANCLLSVGDHCLRSTDYINVIVADKAPHLQYLTMDAAVNHCTKGIGIWDFASNDAGEEPDVVMACAGDIPTAEALAAVAILRERCPEVKIRFVNVVDLFRLMPETSIRMGCRTGSSTAVYEGQAGDLQLPCLSASLIHKLTYKRGTNHDNFPCARIQGEGQHQLRRWSWRF